jgi:hypothetical protein
MQRLTRVGGEFIGWQRDGKKVYYSIGRSYFTYDLTLADSLQRDSTAKAEAKKQATDSLKKLGLDSTGKKIGSDTAKKAPSDTTKKTGADSTKKPLYEASRVDVNIEVKKDRPSGVVVLRGARIVTMKGDEVIENGDVVVRDNHIAAVGPSGSVTVPAGAKVVDVSGKTILPGWVDVHAHMWPAWGGTA